MNDCRTRQKEFKNSFRVRANAQCMRKFYLLQAAAAIEAIMLCSVGANYGTVLLYGAWPGVGDGCGRHGDSEQRCAMRHLQHYDRGIDNNVLSKIKDES